VADQDGQKAIAACVKYAQLADRNAQLGHGIGDAIYECWTIQHSADVEFVDHLKEAWALRGDDDERDFPTDAEVDGALKDCPHCTKAQALIRERKKVRRSFGAAKRQVLMLGRRLQQTEEGDLLGWVRKFFTYEHKFFPNPNGPPLCNTNEAAENCTKCWAHSEITRILEGVPSGEAAPLPFPPLDEVVDA
jgi:hypothetical protein